ncbi:hypothetical protein [Deinococcus alpinitundrae]|uniref:hypothetical protein n=1 Tax=Deinococcus alpinitundrae TaxID=468913 RepID=UPI0013797AA0|nr:hypothetical protein [Deinococcus alpinitundrae]
MKKTLILGMLFLTGTAAAQEVPGLPSLDPSKLGADVFALGGVVLLIVQFVKRQVERAGKKPRPWAWWVLSVLLAEGGAAGLFYSKFGATFDNLPVPWGWLAYGLLAGLAASGFKDLVIGVTKGKPNVAPSTSGLEAMPLLSFQAAGPPQDDPDFPAATRTDWPAVVGDDAPLADQPVNPPPVPAVTVLTPSF